VPGVIVDFNDANIAWAEKPGLTYPLLSDVRRQVSKTYDVLFDDPKLVDDPTQDHSALSAQQAVLVRH
jgi:peroxiredoxin